VDGEPARHVGSLLADGWFDVRTVTADDHARVARYRDELSRKDFLHRFESIEDYLRELRIEVRVSAAEERDVPRVSQLTLRTNQFNLTTRRLQPAEVRALLTDPSAYAVAIRAADRFGDNGLVGAIFASRRGDAVTIENFLLSCRVFSRGIEQAGLSAVLRRARDTGAAAVYGTYRPTAKNGVVRDFYPRYGFRPVAEDGTAVTYRHDLTEIVPAPEHIDLTENLDGRIP
jgi:FkbH-like protein